MFETTSVVLTGEDLERAVTEAAAGDRRALADVLDSVRPVVVRYCRARVGGAVRGHLCADDIAQEVCLAIVTALPRYRPQGKSFLAFVYGIAAHKLTDAYRAASRERVDFDGEVPETVSPYGEPEAVALENEAGAEMARLLGVLGDRQREILVLRLVVGLSAEETAEAVGGTPGSVRVMQHRALAALRAEVSAGRAATLVDGRRRMTG